MTNFGYFFPHIFLFPCACKTFMYVVSVINSLDPPFLGGVSGNQSTQRLAYFHTLSVISYTRIKHFMQVRNTPGICSRCIRQYAKQFHPSGSEKSGRVSRTLPVPKEYAVTHLELTDSTTDRRYMVCLQ